MACDCNSHLAGDAASVSPTDPNAPGKPPCGPCAKMRAAIVPRAVHIGAAADDLLAIQQFLHEITTTQTFPTAAQLQAAQQAATNLSTELPGVPGAPATQPNGSSMTVSPVGVIMMASGAAIVGAALTYILLTNKKRKR